MRKLVLCATALLAACAGQVADAPERNSTPAELFGELFVAVQTSSVFEDSKTFVDTVPREEPAEILRRYRAQRAQSSFDLASFVRSHFQVPEQVASDYQTPRGRDVREHIDQLWEVLTRAPIDEPVYSSRLPLPHRYVVPGGRFREIYYWDSYFTMVGLHESGRHDLIRNMVDNFAHLIDAYGHIPNGNRTYYLSRSQPPFFAAMVELEAAIDGREVLRKRLPQLRREYEYWMEGAEQLAPNTAHRRVVRLQDGAVLNRYWDDRDTPREESYREDVATAQAATRPHAEVYRNLRAAAESGWDFSSRWLGDGSTLATIRTVEIIPVDLNSLLYQLESTLADACEVQRDRACVNDMTARAQRRRQAMLQYFWNDSAGAFTDYDWVNRKPLAHVTAATVYPLFFHVAEPAHAAAVARTIRSSLLAPHGLATTTVRTGQQWDAPNGWAPLQWLAIIGLRHYDEHALAGVIAQRWVAKNLQVYRDTGKLVEKYDVSGTGAGGGGEYPLQDGFGWTNGVLRKLLALYPQLATSGTTYVR